MVEVKFISKQYINEAAAVPILTWNFRQILGISKWKNC
jgi:hypothetical protein